MRPALDGGAVDADALEQALQAVLRVVGADVAPVVLLPVAVEAGQDDAALRQAGDDAQELGHLRDAAGDAGGDDGVLRRLAAPAGGPGGEQAVAALDRVDEALLGHDLGPDLGEELQELERLLPVLGQLALDQPVQARERDVLGRHLVEEAHQLAGEPHGLLVRDPAVLGQHEAGEQEVAPQRRQGRRQVQLGRRVDQQLVGLDLADGLEPGQQQRPLAGGARQLVAQRQAGAAARQQDERVGQDVDRPPHQLRRQRLEERHVRGDGVDGGHARLGNPLGRQSLTVAPAAEIGKRRMGQRRTQVPEHALPHPFGKAASLGLL